MPIAEEGLRVEEEPCDSRRVHGRAMWHGVVALAAALVMFVATGLAVVVGPAAWGQWTGQVRVETLKQGSIDRVYRVYRPSGLPPRPGLVIDLHSARSDGFTEMAISGVWRHAAENGWIVAYPDGVADGWEPYGCCRHDGIDDLAFIAEVIADRKSVV